MKVKYLVGKNAYKSFSRISKLVYSGNPYYRGTEASIEKMLLNMKSAFNQHAEVKLFLLEVDNRPVGRFALIKDHFLKDYLQVSYFEALPDLEAVLSLIKQTAKKYFPGLKKLVIGLNGHLNYGAGILMNRFDEVPMFGLPYNPPYYKDYFSSCSRNDMVTFRFDMHEFNDWALKVNLLKPVDGLKVRFMNKKDIKQESAIYTWLNNQAFPEHPYWAKRENEEDLELFYPFRWLLDNENLIIAEVHKKPVGFFLWYPDFNQLTSTQKDLGLKELLAYRMGKKIDTFRFTEIGIIPKYQKSIVSWELILKSLLPIEKQGFDYCEGGFIFEKNRASILFVKRMLTRCFGYEPEPYRRFATFETTLE